MSIMRLETQARIVALLILSKIVAATLFEGMAANERFIVLSCSRLMENRNYENCDGISGQTI